MRKKYTEKLAKDKYNLLTDDMFYNIIMNLRHNNCKIEKLAENLGITTQELINYIADEHKDFFVCLESLLMLKEYGDFRDYSRIKTYSKSKEK